MRRSHIFLMSVVGFMLLFYKQAVGINLLGFNVLLLILIYLFIPKARVDKGIWILSLGALITSISSAWYADWSSIFLNILTLILLPVFLHQRNATVLFSETLGLWNMISAPVRMVIDRKFDKNESSQNLLMKRILLFGVLPFVVFVLFFYLYRHINPVWGDYMWKMIGYLFSWNFVLLLLFAVIVMYGFWFFVKSPSLNQWLSGRRNELIPTSQPTFKNIPLAMEMWSGVFLFALLNLLLFSLLATDFQQLIMEDKVPEGYTLSEYLHKGVYAVIISIIFAIVLLVFYFKGALNYCKQGKVLRILAWIWIGFNAALVLFTFYKNILYVEVYDLTFKRVSVFIYLLLCWVGLYFTAVKLQLKKTFVYIVRKMYWAFYIMWVLTTPINWTNWITEYNLNHAKERNYEGSIDIDYLTNEYKLNELNITALYRFLQDNPENPYAEYIKRGLDDKFLKVVESDNARKWRGKRLYDGYIKNKLRKQGYKPYYAKVFNARYYPELAEVEELEFQLGYRSDEKDFNDRMEKLLKYKKVRLLTLVGDTDYLESLTPLESMSKLKVLNLEKMNLQSGFLLKGLSQLEELTIHISNAYFRVVSEYPKLKTLRIHGYGLQKLEGLEKFKALTFLNINSSGINSLDITPLNNLEELYVFNSDLRTLISENPKQKMKILHLKSKKWGGISSLPEMPNLNELSLNNCKVDTLNGIDRFPLLQTLFLDRNAISSLGELETLKKIEYLSLNYNQILDISPLKELQALKKLHLKGNRIKNYGILYSLPNLRRVDLAYNVIEKLDKSKLSKDLKFLTKKKHNASEYKDVAEVLETISEE